MIPRVAVRRADLASALKQLAKFVTGRMRQSDVVLSWHDGGLAIDVAGQRAGVPAHGRWEGEVRVPARVLLGIARRLPARETLDVWVEGGRLHVGSVSVKCTWAAQGPAQIELPLDPPLTLLLSLPYRHTPEEIAHSGLAPLLRDAQERRDRLVLRAAAILQPLGVAPEDLVELVDQTVARLHPKPGAP